MHVSSEQLVKQTEDNRTDESYGSSFNTVRTPDSLRDRYRFITELGHGAQAKVFLAKRLSDNTKVTIKQLNVGSVKSWKEYELFHRESAVLSALNIDGVARFYESIECLNDDPPCSYIVQEFVEGTSLANLLHEGRRFRITDIYDIIIKLLMIIDKLQSRNPVVIHRDIKPSNIMVSPDNEGSYHVTLIDFGAVANPQIKGTGSTVAGTFGYMPPEQLMGKPVPASDIYAVAAVAVELFSGKSPADLPTKDFRLIFEPELEQMPPALVNTLRQMLEPKVENRLCDIHEIIRRFTSFKDDKYNTEIKSLINLGWMYDEYEKVQHIGANGNIDIWQSLPDQVPREIPNSLEIYFQNFMQFKSYSPNIKAEKYLSENINKKPLVFKQVYKQIRGELLTGNEDSSSISLNMKFWIAGIVLYFLIAVYFIGILGIFVAFLSLWVFGVIYSVTSRNQKNVNELSESMKKTHVFLYRMCPYCEVGMNILKYGRKTIATITEVKYLAAPVNRVIVNMIDGRRIMPVVNCSPRFLIRYKFNPPDDSKEEDLLHACVVHCEPEHHYQVGDPLPILYLISHQNGIETVASMVFPFPIENAMPDELVCVNDSVIKNYVNKSCTTCIGNICSTQK